jgi:predicted Fe-S protein YdhL (DUF1289 family)
MTDELEELLRLAKLKWEAMSDKEKDAILHRRLKEYVEAKIQWAKDFREGKCERD